MSLGIKQTIDIDKPVTSSYTLGTHKMVIQRATGFTKNHLDIKVSLEVVCSLLKKAAVCWLTMTTDSNLMAAFENSTVSLEGDAATTLVPAMAFGKKAKIVIDDDTLTPPR